MRNEVYGSVELDVCMVTKSKTGDLALLEANYMINNERIYKKCELVLEDIKGNVHTVKVNNVNDVTWKNFFSENE